MIFTRRRHGITSDPTDTPLACPYRAGLRGRGDANGAPREEEWHDLGPTPILLGAAL